MAKLLNLTKLRTKPVTQRPQGGHTTTLGHILVAPEPEDSFTLDAEAIKSSELFGINEYERPTPTTLHCKGIFYFERIVTYTGEIYDIQRIV